MAIEAKKYPMPTQEAGARVHNFDEVALGYPVALAKQEAARCLNCKNRPCVQGCPVNIQIPDFIAHIKAGDYEGAYQVIAQDSALPAVCGRVCPQESQCESKCTLGVKFEPVAIGRLERFAADWHLAHHPEQPERPAANGHRVAVVGSGPSGLTCAGELARRGYQETVFEALHAPGGVLSYGIPEFRLPKAIVAREVENLRALGVKIETNVVIGKTLTVDELFDDGFEAVFIGSGAGLPRFMGIEGEGLRGVYCANEFLTRANLMKAYRPDAATPILRGGRVAVIGGGNVAMDVARTAKLLGAEEVTVVYRRKESDMKAERQEIDEALAEGIVLKTEHKPLRIEGEGKVRALVCDAGEIVCDTVIAAIGQRVDLGGIAPEAMVIRENGTIDAAELTYQTAQKDIFAVGDVFSGPKYVIDAIAAGREAAISMHRFMRPKTSLTLNRNRRDFIELDKSKVAIPVSELKAPARAEGELTEELVRQEASRCLGCGAAVVDTNRCLGCGVCTTRCRFDAIHLSRDLPECSDLVDRFDSNKKLLPYMIKRGIKIKKKELAEKFKK